MKVQPMVQPETSLVAIDVHKPDAAPSSPSRLQLLRTRVSDSQVVQRALALRTRAAESAVGQRALALRTRAAESSAGRRIVVVWFAAKRRVVDNLKLVWLPHGASNAMVAANALEEDEASEPYNPYAEEEAEEAALKAEEDAKKNVFERRFPQHYRDFMFWKDKVKRRLPPRPKSWAHFWIRKVVAPVDRIDSIPEIDPLNKQHDARFRSPNLVYDRLLNFLVPHWCRYWFYSGIWHVFPYWYGYMISSKLPGQCNVELVPWMQVTGTVSCARLFGLCPCQAIRIRNRRWENQNFGEAMGELWRDMTDGTHDLDPSCIKGPRLNLIVIVYHFLETCWMWYGWHIYDSIQVCDDSIMKASVRLLCYQMFNLSCFSLAVDFAWPWFYLEFQEDVRFRLCSQPLNELEPS